MIASAAPTQTTARAAAVRVARRRDEFLRLPACGRRRLLTGVWCVRTES
jgi:hypothetical protein